MDWKKRLMSAGLQGHIAERIVVVIEEGGLVKAAKKLGCTLVGIAYRLDVTLHELSGSGHGGLVREIREAIHGVKVAQ